MMSLTENDERLLEGLEECLRDIARMYMKDQNRAYGQDKKSNTRRKADYLRRMSTTYERIMAAYTTGEQKKKKRILIHVKTFFNTPPLPVTVDEWIYRNKGNGDGVMCAIANLEGKGIRIELSLQPSTTNDVILTISCLSTTL